VDGGVELEWDVSADEPVAGYRIYRTSDGDGFPVTVGDGLIRPAERRFLDRTAADGAEYGYTLGVVLSDGTEYHSQSVAVTTPAGQLSLEQNAPNPFNPTTRISFVLPRAGVAQLVVYDAEGRRVRVLAAGPHPRGRSEVSWDGRDERGIPVGSGVYFCRMRFGERILSQKMVLLK
jgi:hypothetical protein